MTEDDPGTLAQEVDIVIENPVEEDPADVIVVETPVEDARPSSSLNNLKMTPTRAPRKTKPGRLCQEDSIRKNMKRRGQGGSSPVATHFVRSLDLRPNLSVKCLAAQIETSQQFNLTPAIVCGQQPKHFLTKPLLVYSSVGVQMPSKPRCTSPSNQWEESRGISLRSMRPSGQSDQQNEQTHEQKLQIGLRRKDLTRPASTQ